MKVSWLISKLKLMPKDATVKMAHEIFGEDGPQELSGVSWQDEIVVNVDQIEKNVVILRA